MTNSIKSSKMFQNNLYSKTKTVLTFKMQIVWYSIFIPERQPSFKTVQDK